MTFTPKSGGVWGFLGRVLSRRLALVLAALLMLAPAPASRAEDGGVLADFYSYLPAVPKLSLPRVNIPFWTDDLKKGKNAFQDGNYGKALKFFRRESDNGNPVADWYLGRMYQNGQGVPQDDAIAFTYFSRVSDLYDPDETDERRLAITIDSMLRVADYQRDGVAAAGIPQNASLAARTYLNLATTFGHPAAQYALGVMNMKGTGMRQNPQQGLKWLIAAARKRHVPAEAYLGELYSQGKYVQQDQTRAIMWFMLAVQSAKAEQNPEIFDRLSAMKASASEDQLLEAEARARVWDNQYPVKKTKFGF